MDESKNKIIVYDSASIQRKIYTIRDAQVMLDSDLAAFYGVETKVLNRAAKRNINRFPEEFMFSLSDDEWASLRFQNGTLKNDNSLRFQNGTSKDDTAPLSSQIVTLKNNRGKHRKYLPYVFTEQGVAMLSGVLRSETAVKMSIQKFDRGKKYLKKMLGY